MQGEHAAPTVQITGSRTAIDWALQQGLLSNPRLHTLHGISWIELADISDSAEFEMKCGGCRVHRR